MAAICKGEMTMNIQKKITDFMNDITKKGFYIELEDEYKLPSREGFVPPKPEVVQKAVENYCVENKHTFEYVSMENPVIFILDGKEVYIAEPVLFSRGFMREFCVKCTELK